MILLFLLTGHIADKFDRRKVIIVAETTFAVCMILMSVASLTGVFTKELMLFFVVIIGAAYAFQQPASVALLPIIVSKEDFPKATAFMTSMFQFATVIGPAAGGLIVEFGSGISYIVISILAVISVFSISKIKIEPSLSKNHFAKKQKFSLNLKNKEKKKSIFSELLFGFNFIKSRPAIFGAITLDLFVVLFGGATALLPIYASEILNVGSSGYGILRSAQALGALVMCIILVKHTIKNKVGIKMFICVICFGFSTCIFAISENFLQSIFMLIFLGAFDAVSAVIRSSYIQLNTPDYVRGRVSSIKMLFSGTSNELGAFESGTLATFIGVAPCVFIGGVLSIGTAVLWMKFFPELRKLNSLTGDK
jgi:MFS family permease